MRAEKTGVPKKMIGTLTLSILISVHTIISPLIVYMLCRVDTPRHPEPLLQENHVRIVAITPDAKSILLQRDGLPLPQLPPPSLYHP